ncbi:MAG: hypothetical protein E7219_02925 [Clostridiales bacterium]|nr:hypothetical protein [Clostridiales bacterium]
MKRFKALVLVIALAMISSSLGSCATPVEAADLNGMLTVVREDSIVVNNAKGSYEFATDENTRYEMGEQGRFTMNDIVHVSYHKKGKKMIADGVSLRKHIHKDLTFSGTVSGLEENKSVSVTGDSLTVTFAYDANTAVEGRLAKGDEVRVTYLGDLSEYPRADRIVVTKEAPEEPETLTATGVVSLFGEKSLLLSIDSAHDRKFSLDKNTKITGVAKALRIGDSVKVTFRNTNDEAPLATEINIIKESAPDIRTINGIVKSYDAKSIVIDTAKKTYKYAVNKDTKYKGVSPQAGYLAEVTYDSTDKDKPVATIIYCKKGEEPQPAPTPTPTPTPEEPVSAQGKLIAWSIDGQDKCTISIDGSGELTFAYSGDSLEIAPGYAPQADDFVSVLYTASNMTLKRIDLISRPEQPVNAEGTLTAWGVNGENKCTIAVKGGDELALTYKPEELVIPYGYFPQADDAIRFLYMDSTKVLMQIELVSRPEKEEQTEPEQKPEEQTEPEQKPEEQTEPEQKQEEPQTAPEAKKEEEQPVSVKATAELVSSEPEKKISTFRLENGETVDLNYSKDTARASGYFPQPGDKVDIIYTKEGMLLNSIQLIERPAPAADTAEQ